jgi:hypothetical protein
MLHMLEILGCCLNHKSDTCSKVDGKTKFTSAEGCASDQSQAGEHIEWKVYSVSISHAGLPLTLMDRFGFTILLIG